MPRNVKLAGLATPQFQKRQLFSRNGVFFIDG